jgi:mercuric ion binding protein
MKKIILVFSCLLVGIFLHAQVMSAKAKTVIIKSTNLRCWECSERLDKYLTVENKSFLESALIEWKINLQKGEIKIKYLPDRANIEDIKAVINNAGFDADDEKAEPEAYKKLPTACKRVEDGGGPKNGKPCHIKPN